MTDMSLNCWVKSNIPEHEILPPPMKRQGSKKAQTHFVLARQ